MWLSNAHTEVSPRSKGTPYLPTISWGISFLTTLMQAIALCLACLLSLHLVPHLTVLFFGFISRSFTPADDARRWYLFFSHVSSRITIPPTTFRGRRCGLNGTLGLQFSGRDGCLDMPSLTLVTQCGKLACGGPRSYSFDSGEESLIKSRKSCITG